MLIIDILLKILNLFGIRVNTKEYRIRTSYKFKETFKDIRVVKKSKQNYKIKSSINYIALSLFLLSISIVIINLQVVSGNFITAWLFEHNPFPALITTQETMDITLIAVLFSIMSFSLSKIIDQWKETAKFRKTKQEMRSKQEVLSRLSAKDLLDAAKQKDLENYTAQLKNTKSSKNTEDINKEKIKTDKKQKVKEAKKESNAQNF